MPVLSGMACDVENRLTQVTHSVNGTDKYRDDPANRRLWRQRPDAIHVTVFYGLAGERMGRYAGTSSFATRGTSVYFAGKLIWDGWEGTPADRLGSVVNNNRKYFPYGEEPVTTTNNRTKFATYFRDSTTALDYADQQYYARTIGRFLTADASRRNERLIDPQSWNRYSYVQGDPVNFSDPEGLNMKPEVPLEFWNLPAFGTGFAGFYVDGVAVSSRQFSNYIGSGAAVIYTGPTVVQTAGGPSPVSIDANGNAFVRVTTYEQEVTPYRTDVRINGGEVLDGEEQKAKGLVPVTKEIPLGLTTPVPKPVLLPGPSQLPPQQPLPTDPTVWSNPFPQRPPSGNYWDFLACQVSEAAAGSDTLGEVLVGAAVAIALRPAPGVIFVTGAGWAATWNSLVRRPCVNRVYGPGAWP